jgi:hypothetical protein
LLSRLPGLSLRLLSKLPVSISGYYNRDDYDKLFDRDANQSYDLNGNLNLHPSAGVRDKHVNNYNGDN